MSLIDDTHSVCLCDVGAPGYVAVTAVAEGGITHLVLASRADINGDAHYDPAVRDAPHEQTGELPATYWHRLARAQLRCTRPTKAGRPCRTPVARPGDACAWHRVRATTEYQEETAR